MKGEYAILRFMSVQSCRVTIQDLEGVTHTVEVTAESLYEAVAQGLAALRRSDWVHGFQQGIVKVSVADVRVEHQVKLSDFTQWLEKPGAKSPREMIQRQRLRSILGMPTHTSKQCTHRAKNKYEKQNELACCYGKRFKTSDYTSGVCESLQDLV